MKSARMIVLMTAMLLAVNVAPAQWTRLTMDHGGVVEDLQLIVRDDQPEPEDQNVVWSADMGNAFFRATWNTTTHMWSAWQEYLPGKKGYGVDAIEVNDGQNGEVEHVYLATGGMGPWYASSTTGSFPEVWDRPIIQNSFPRVWKHSALQDVAFYWPDEGTPTAPQTQFYILGNAGGFNNGVYRWYVPPEPLGFTRIDEDYQGDQYHNYSHFYRDVNDKNVLYVRRGVRYDENYTPEESGGLFKLSSGNPGSGYGSEDPFVNLIPTTIIPQTLPDYGQVLGFSQWRVSENEVYYYLFVEIHSGSLISHKVYFTNSLLNQNTIPWNWAPLYDCSNLFSSITPDPNLDWSMILNSDYNGAGVIGRPNGENHDLWLTHSLYGVWYVNSGAPNSPVQINGSSDPTNPNVVPALKRWSPRAYVMDSPEHFGSNIMRLFFGTHQAGVWYLKFCPAE